MRRNLLFLALLLIGVANPMWAQKYACVNTDYILKSIPDYTNAQKRLDKYVSEWQNELSTKMDNLSALRSEYEKENYLLPENLKKKRLEELKEKEAEIKALQKQRFGPGGDMDKKSAELIKPVQDRIYAAIERVAHEKNFAFVFDKAASSTVLFANKKYDISDDVLELLGYKPGAANDMSVPADKNQHQRASNPEMRQQDPNTASPLGRMR